MPLLAIPFPAIDPVLISVGPFAVRWYAISYIVGISVFLMADAVTAAKAGQKTPEGYYNVERMLRRMLAGKGEVLLCGTCMDARGMTDDDVMDGARRSSMDELATATIAADKVIVF